jgi:hypothetical protein
MSLSSSKSTANIRRSSSGSQRKRRSRALRLNAIGFPIRARVRRDVSFASSGRATSVASRNKSMKEIKRKTDQGPNPAEE